LERFEWRYWGQIIPFNLVDSIRPDNLTAFTNANGLDSKTIEILAKFTRLTLLKFTTTNRPQDLTAILSLTALTDLSARGVTLYSASRFTKLGNSQRLSLYDLDEELDGNGLVLTALTNLVYLYVSGTEVHRFDIRGLKGLKDLGFQENGRYLQVLQDPNDFVENLERLHLYGKVVSGVTWKDISTWTSLRSLYLNNYTDTDPDVIPQLTTLKHLTRLTINFMPWHENFTMLSTLHSLIPKSKSLASLLFINTQRTGNKSDFLFLIFIVRANRTLIDLGTLPHDVVRLKMPFYERM
jgi:hypothetical protein